MSKWDWRFLDLAEHISGWSRDPSTKVGAIIVRPDKTIASAGFNGFPRGVGDAEARYNARPVKYMMIVHAELNAILTAREPLQGYTIYTPMYPCNECAKSIIQAGIMRVVTKTTPEEMAERWGDSFTASRQMFSEADIEVVEYSR